MKQGAGLFLRALVLLQTKTQNKLYSPKTAPLQLRETASAVTERIALH
jgi:hypothetical protein